MSKRSRGKSEVRPLVVKRAPPPAEAGHHGGAWKIAYADFVTAMMAFFLLMWLVNATTEAQRRGIADYFAPSNALVHGASGAGQPFGGRSLNTDQSLMADAPVSPMLRPGQPGPEGEEEAEEYRPDQGRPAARAAPVPGPRPEPQPEPQATPPAPSPADPARLAAEAARNAVQLDLARLEPARDGARPDPARGEAAPAEGPSSGAAREAAQAAAAREIAQAAAREAARREAIARAAEEVRDAVRNDPALASLSRQLLVEEVPEGLRVQLVDAEGQPVFQTGQAAPNERGRALLARVAAVLARRAHPVEITGHTDAAPFRGGDRSNWDLSAERANATRRLLIEGGVAEPRIRAVAGRADRDPLLPRQPLDPANRRVAVLMIIPPTEGTGR